MHLGMARRKAHSCRMKVRLALVALVVAGCRQTENRLHDAEDVATIDVATIDAQLGS